MKRKMVKTAIAAGMFLVVSLFFIGCDTPVPYLLLQEVSDGANNGGDSRFYFLPPIVSEPGTGGEALDSDANPEVVICRLEATGECETIKEFSQDYPPAPEVSTDGEYYQVDWSTCEDDLEDDTNYKIMVNAYEMTLGYAVVSLATLGDLKNTDTNDLIPLEEDRILPIKFRIEEGIGAEPCGSAVCTDRYGETCDCAEDCVYCKMTVCPAGLPGIYDPSSGFCWLEPDVDRAPLYVYHHDAVDYCDLGGNWRLPSISELRTLVRGCAGIEWDWRWTECDASSGCTCNVSDYCFEHSCLDTADCYPVDCVDAAGPGNGCYWDKAMHGPCNNYYWTRSTYPHAGDGPHAWVVDFQRGGVGYALTMDDMALVRCVWSANVEG
ncbi:MAG: hypothetical protein GY762_10815 [Proteobacteria bacterium]|nr:hypothetical protein [Pseudomonadota bacterium]